MILCFNRKIIFFFTEKFTPTLFKKYFSCQNFSTILGSHSLLKRSNLRNVLMSFHVEYFYPRLNNNQDLLLDEEIFTLSEISIIEIFEYIGGKKF